MTAAPWKTRPASRWVLAFFILLAGGALFLTWRLKTPDKAKPRAAYLVATDGQVFVRIGLRTRRIAGVETICAGQTVALPTGKTVTALYSDGRREKLTGPRRITFPTTKSDFPILTKSLSELMAKPALKAPTPGTPTMPVITSPVGATRFRNPTLTWESDPGTTYDAAIGDPVDPEAPPRVAHFVAPPLPFKTLQSTLPPLLTADRLMAAIVRATGNVSLRGTSRFLVAPDATAAELPSDPALLLLEAFQAVTQLPARTGDAWLALSALPPEWRKSELAVRLRLKVAADVGASKAYAEAMTDAAALAHR